MKSAALAGACAAALVAAALILSGCNDVGSCPAKTSITPGSACEGDSLECAYDLATPSPACDGTSTTISTSCTCTKGTWACPAPVACAPSGDDGGGDDGGGDDGSSDSPGDDGGGNDAPGD